MVRSAERFGINYGPNLERLGKEATHRIVLEVAANADGTYEIIVNGEVVEKLISERWLDDELCAKRGCCGKELVDIRRQLRERGKAVLTV